MRFPRPKITKSNVAIAVVAASLPFGLAVTVILNDNRNQEIACNAVDKSNDANFKLWHDAIVTSSRANDPKVQKFFENYQKTLDQIAQDCRK